MKYDNILNNFEFEGSISKVKVTVAFFRKKKTAVQCFHLLTDFDIYFHTNFRYGNIFDKICVSA